MQFNLSIRYKKPGRREFLLWTILLLPFFFGLLMDLLGLPDMVKYICDVCWLCLLGKTISLLPRADRPVKLLAKWIGGFLVLTLFVYIYNYQSALYYLWGLRNNFRFYVFFFALILFFRKAYVDTALKLFDVLFWINVPISLLQFFAFGLNQDFLGGLFGTQVGVNAYTNCLFLIVTTKSLIYFLNKKESIALCLAKCGTALVIAAIAELKFFYMEFAFVVIAASMITKFTWRKLLVIVGGFIGISLTAALLVNLFPNFADFLSLESILDTAGNDRGYTGSGDLNRLNSIPVIISRFLGGSGQQVFGMGLGNCDTSSFDFLNTPFYQQYSWLHYSWMSVAFMFLENGFAGLVFFLGFFVLVFFLLRRQHAGNIRDLMHIQISRIIALCCLMLAVYNSTLRIEAGYMMYFVLAMGFIAGRKHEPAVPRRSTPRR